MLQITNNEGSSDFDRGFATSLDPAGRFVFQSVPLGQYTVTALLNPPSPQMPVAVESTPQLPRYWAQSAVTVAAGQDVTGIVLELQRGGTVSGQIVFEGAARQPPGDLTRGQISIFPFSPPTGGFAFESNARGTVDATGRFTIPDVLPGKYRVSATFPGPTPWLLQEVVVGGPFRHHRRRERTAGNGAHTPLVSNGSPVLNAPVAPHPVHPRGADGNYSFRGVPPGEYRLTSLIDPDADVLYSRETLEQLDATSARITLSKGDKRVEHVRVR